MRRLGALAVAIALAGTVAVTTGAGAGLATPGTADPLPAPSTNETPNSIVLEYSMPKRFGKRGKNGLAKYPTRRQISPRAWRVNFVVRHTDGRACRPGDVLTVRAPRAAKVRFVSARRSPCRFYGLFPREGSYPVNVTLNSARGEGTAPVRVRRKVVVQDWLIFGLGDSNGSGEGTPDAPSQLLGLTPAKWQNPACDRSARSYQAQAARLVERNDRQTSVTFVHRACSGASIKAGLLTPFRRINEAKPYAPQISAMRSLAQGREIDAVLISIGANDVGFFSVIMHCIEFANCPRSAFPQTASKTTLKHVVRERLATLPVLYARLARAPATVRIPADRVFITEYFDPTKDDRGMTCDPLLSTPLGTIERGEAQWASDHFVSPLNQAVRAAAKKHGWRAVTGAQAGFGTHGYCAVDPWIVGLAESLTQQGNVRGTLHSNTRGNTFQATLASKALRLDFYDNERPRSPAGHPLPLASAR